MTKFKSKSKSTSYVRRSLLFIVLSIFAAVMGYGIYNKYLRPASAPIFLIEQTPLAYGETTLTGYLTKDSEDSFILVVPENRAISLDVSGLDHLLTKTVTVKGVLIPPEGSLPGYMSVKSLSVME